MALSLGWTIRKTTSKNNDGMGRKEKGERRKEKGERRKVE